MTTQEIFRPESKTIKEIFGDAKAFYQIPNYQRPYSWMDEQVDQLWEDIFTAYQNNKEDSTVDENYFLGSLVMIQNHNSYDIVDGQQRLTTLTILFCVLRDLNLNLDKPIQNTIINSIVSLTEDRQRLRLLTHSNSQNEFEQTIIKKIKWPDKFMKKDKRDNKFMNTALIFKQKILDLDLDTLKEFIDYLFNKVRLITITCSTQSFAIKLFQVINTRGMDLSAADLVKSLLLSRISDDKYNQFMDNWKEVEHVAKDVGETITDIFTYYEYYLLATNPKRGLYEELSEVFKNKDSNDIIYDFKKFAENYRDVKMMKDKVIYSLHYLRHQIYWKSILATAKHVNFISFDELAEAIRNMYYLYWIGGYTSAKIKQISFNIIGWLKEGKDITFIIDELKKKVKEDGVVNRFKTNISEDCYGESWLKPLLIILEYYQVDNSNPLNYIDIDRQIHVEHILPQNNRNIEYWKDLYSDSMAEDVLMKIGNLTLLSGVKNIRASDRPYNLNYSSKEKEKYKDGRNNVYIDKRYIYRGKGFDGITGFAITQDIINKYEKWSYEDYKQRHNSVMEQIGVILNVDLSDLYY